MHLSTQKKKLKRIIICYIDIESYIYREKMPCTGADYCNCASPCGETARWEQGQIRAQKYKAKVNKRKLVCGGTHKNGKACEWKYDPRKAWACKKHMKTVPCPDDFEPPEEREVVLDEVKVTTTRPTTSREPICITYPVKRAGEKKIICHLYENQINEMSHDVLRVWKKICGSHLDKIFQSAPCKRNLKRTYILQYMLELINAQLDA